MLPAPKPPNNKQHMCVCFALPPLGALLLLQLSLAAAERRACVPPSGLGAVLLHFLGGFGRARARAAQGGGLGRWLGCAPHTTTQQHITEDGDGNHRRRRQMMTTTTPPPRRREALGPAAAPPAFFFLLYRLTQRHLALCVCVCARVCVFCGERQGGGGQTTGLGAGRQAGMRGGVVI